MREDQRISYEIKCIAIEDVLGEVQSRQKKSPRWGALEEAQSRQREELIEILEQALKLYRQKKIEELIRSNEA